MLELEDVITKSLLNHKSIDLLKNLIENDMITDTSITDENDILMRMSARQILKNHKFAIWQGQDGAWYTYLPDKTKGRLQRKRKTRAEIEETVIEFYNNEMYSPTIETLFYEWINGRMERQAIQESTYTKYTNDFKRCFNDGFEKMRIGSVTQMDIEEFVLDCIHRKNMSRKAYSNIRTLLYGIFRSARKRNLTDLDIKQVLDDIDFCNNDFVHRTYTDDQQVFMLDEEKTVIDYLTEHQDIINLGLLLLFKTGLRIGELSALSKADINGNCILIHSTETIYRDRETHKMVYEVRNAPKTEAGIREVYVPNNAIWLLKAIRDLCPFGEYVFMDNGSRIRSYVFRQRLYRVCKETGAIKKGLHKIRKTYGSKLYDSEMPKATVAELMGHTDITCLEKYYYFNRMSAQQKQDAINNVIGL